MDEETLNDALGLVKEARLWMQAEMARNSSVRMRQSDWNWLIVRLLAVEDLLDPPKEKDKS